MMTFYIPDPDREAFLAFVRPHGGICHRLDGRIDFHPIGFGSSHWQFLADLKARYDCD